MLAFIAAHDATCTYCGRRGGADRDPDGQWWGRDHVVPRAAGGTGRRGNLVLCCARCNGRKGALPLADFLLSCPVARW